MNWREKDSIQNKCRVHNPSLVLTLLCLCLCLWAGPASAGPIKIVQAPANSLVPDVVMDATGVLHIIYGLDHNAWYVRSTDNGQTFTAPVKVNSEGQVETRMGERGPKLSLGRNGSLHVVWADYWAPGVKTFVRYARSLDGGKSFEPMKTISAMSGVDGVTLAADEKDHVAAFWHVMADPKPTVKAATWLHTARSSDNGVTFGPNEKVKIANLSSLACSMCLMRARVATGGQVYLAFRSAQGNIRDFYVLQGEITDNNFHAQRVNEDNWHIDSCPMCGPELTFGPSGQALCAFMSRQKVYWAASEPGSNSWQLHVATPGNEENEIYPSALANRQGQVLFVWQIGPMATKGTATVQWAIYDRTGKPTGETGVVGKSFAGTKATAFVGTDDNFYIVTTAR